MAFFEHPLDDPATELIEAILDYMQLDLANEINKYLRVYLRAHLSYDLLHHMVSIEIEWAIFHPFLIQKFLHQNLPLGVVEDFDSCLNDPASMLISGVLEHVATDIAKNNVQVFLFDAVDHLDLLDDIVAETVED